MKFRKSKSSDNHNLNNQPIQKKESQQASFQDNSDEAIQMKVLQSGIDQSDEVKQLKKLEDAAATNQEQTVATTENNTGLPDELKVALEKLSGYSMDDVQVHYDSDKPAEIGALAYASGSHIFLGPGEDKHLAHEAWHVVQQKEGRVAKTTETNSGVPVNDEPSLEKEADTMGDTALKQPTEESPSTQGLEEKVAGQAITQNKSIVQKEEGEKSYYEQLKEAGMSVGEMLSQSYQDGKDKFGEVAEMLDPSQLSEYLPTMPEVLNSFLEYFWPSNSGWQLGLAANAGGTIAATDAGFPVDIDFGVSGQLELGLMRKGYTVEMTAKVTESGSASGAPSIKAAKLPIGVKLEACDAFKLSMDLGNMDLQEHAMACLQQRNLKGFIQEAFSTLMSIGGNTQIEYTKSVSQDTTVTAELGADTLAKAFAEAGLKQGLEATFANSTETMDGKAELKGEISQHGKVGYSLLGGDDSISEVEQAILKFTELNTGAIKEGGIEGAQGLGLRITANFPASGKNQPPNYELAVYAKNEIGLSFLGQSGKLSANNEVVLALPEVQGFIDALQSPEGVGVDDAVGLVPFSKLNSELSGEVTLRSLAGMLPDFLMEEDKDEIDERNGKLKLKLEFTKDKLLQIINNNLDKGEEVMDHINGGDFKSALLTLLDLFAENVADVLDFFKAIEIETKSSNVERAGVQTPAQGDITGGFVQGSVTTSSIRKYNLNPQDLQIDHIQNFLRNIIA